MGRVKLPRAAVLGHDSSWGGWGWCLGTDLGPVAVGHLVLKGRSWRWDALRQTLEALELELVEASAMLPPGAPPPRVVVEVAPPVYKGASRGKRKAGNQAATGMGIGLLAGPLLLWGTRPGRLAYPWDVEPGDWRVWWLRAGERRPKGRAQWKAWAIQTVQLLGWGHHLEPFHYDPDDGGPRGDVAEAILITVGAARNHRSGPRGPDPRRSPAWRTS